MLPSPMTNASYSASLFDAGNSRQKACSRTKPSGDIRTISAPEHLQFKASLTNSSNFPLSELNWVSVGIVSAGAHGSCQNLAMKSARTCLLIAVRGLYSMSNDPNCTPNLVILLEKSDLCNNILRKRSINTVTVLSWK